MRLQIPIEFIRKIHSIKYELDEKQGIGCNIEKMRLTHKMAEMRNHSLSNICFQPKSWSKSTSVSDIEYDNAMNKDLHSDISVPMRVYLQSNNLI